MEEILNKCKKAQLEIQKLTNKEIERLIEVIKGEMTKNIDIIERAYKVENKEEFDSNLYLDSIKKEDFKYGKVEDSFKSEYGIVNKTYTPYGIVGIIYDGNIYATISIIIKCIQTRNAVILCTNKNVGMIYIIIEEIRKVLKQIKVEEIMQIETKMTNIFKSNEIEKLIYIGKREAYENIKSETTKEVEYSGYMNYEMYIEDEIDIELIEKIEKTGVKMYRNIKLEDAISKINSEGGKYSVGIMTKSSESAKKFVDNINASNVMINTSPKLTKILDIDCKDLIYKKNVLVFE